MDTRIPEIDQARNAGDLLDHITKLKARVAEILDPMVERLLKAEDVAAIREIAEILPKGKHRKILKRAAHDIEDGVIPQGRRAKLTPDQTIVGTRVVYSDHYLEQRGIWVTPRMLERQGTVVGQEHFDWKLDRCAKPTKNGRTYVHVRWDDGEPENEYLDYDAEYQSNLSAV